MSVNKTDNAEVEKWDEYDAPDFSEYEDENKIELTCKVCGMPVRLGVSLSEDYTWELVCVRCGVVPSIEVEGDVVTAVKKAEEVNGDA